MLFRILPILLLVLAWFRVEPEIPRIETFSIAGLNDLVEIVIDPWGIAHIYAQNQTDLFFAQGFNAARDRLFQLELWRRSATGTMSEVLGPEAVNQDIGARLLKLRLGLQEELNHYHPDGEEIINSFVRGYNTYVAETEKDPSLLPPEFELLGFKPGKWTPEVVVSRHNGLFRNAIDELKIGRLVHLLGQEKAGELLPLSPGSPDLSPAPGLDLSLLTDNVLELYQASRTPMEFLPTHVADGFKRIAEAAPILAPFPPVSQDRDAGSNNWAISGRHTITGKPFMANDPHRSLQIPSLRYWVHLVAPGWNVIGGGEPALPGVSIGHNAYGAWGLTIFAVDQEDIYVYETNESDPLLYKYRDTWERMEVIQERIGVRDSADLTVDLKYTRHGPVIYQDIENQKAFVLRAAWLQKGAAPYLASLRIDQASNWEEFRDALAYFRTPSENMVWADRRGNIGWQAAGITPIRPNWSGLLPVPGDGRFEWDGYLPIRMLPHVVNPPEGFVVTANQNNLPDDYPYAVGYLWSDPYRHARIIEFLNQKRRFSLNDMISLQLDVLSIPARSLVPLLKGLTTDESDIHEACKRLLAWDFSMDSSSTAAAIFLVWERKLRERIYRLSVPDEAHSRLVRKSTSKMIDWLTAPDSRFGSNPVEGRDHFLVNVLREAVEELRMRFGAEMDDWRLGDRRLHHAWVRHPLSKALRPGFSEPLDVGPVPRPGNGTTVNMTTDEDNQSSGGTFRVIADLADWDRSLGSNYPGQSGNPENAHYQDLRELWAHGKYFPLYYSHRKIDSVARSKFILKPLVD